LVEQSKILQIKWRKIMASTAAYNALDNQICKIGAHNTQPLPPGMSIIYINGMKNTWLDSGESAVDISRSINYKVKNIYNHSIEPLKAIKKLVEWIVADFNECQSQLKAQALDTNKVCIILIAHSHGTAILENALQNENIQSIKSYLHIIGVGGAALIPTLGYKTVSNLINDCDLIPLVAHSSFENARKSLEASFSRDSMLSSALAFLIVVVIGGKNKFAEDILKISSHKKPELSNMILCHMAVEWQANESADESVKRVAACFRHLVISAPSVFSENPTQKDREKFHEILSLHRDYRIKTLKRSAAFSEDLFTNYFHNHHSINAYLGEICEITRTLIKQHEENIKIGSP
jgi:hypothetical protein